MLRKFKRKFWNYIIPRIAKRLTKHQQIKTALKKEKLFQEIQSVGSNCSLNGKDYEFRSPKKIIFGNNVHIGNNFFIDGRGGVNIGHNVHIDNDVSIISAFYNYESKTLPYYQSINFKPVHVEENVWIDIGVYILPGVRIGKGAIVGKGAVVQRDIEAGEIVGAPKIRHIAFRNKIHYQKLENKNSYSSFKGKPLPLLEKNNLFPSYYENREKNIVFILGTGRSGSNAIVNILNQNPNCKAFHEDVRQLIRISTKLAETPEHKADYFQELEDIFKTKIWQAGESQTLIHSDQRLWNLVPFLKVYFPNSKFIHLKREKYSCIKSMYARNWYSQNEYPDLMNHDWAKYRLQANKINALSNDEWQRLDALEKCAWYWNFINLQIENELSKIESSRIMCLNLEDLERTKIEWARFISDEDFDFKIVRTNEVKKDHLDKYENVKEKELRAKIDSCLDHFKSA